jgi:PrcB C-terminal
MARRYAFLIPVALAACAGGTTMRTSKDDADDSGPVSLAPAPEAPPESTAATPSQPTANEPSIAQPTAPQQGYAPYGSSGGLEIRRIGQWTRTGIGEARRLVIRDANAWAAFWSELGVGTRPAVDFSRDLVIAVAAGQRPSGGHQIAIDRVTRTGGDLRVEVLEISPGPNCMTSSSLTQPVDVVMVSGVNPLSWSFVERSEVRGCR